MPKILPYKLTDTLMQTFQQQRGEMNVEKQRMFYLKFSLEIIAFLLTITTKRLKEEKTS